MKVIETKVYTYGELSEEAKEKARVWMQDGGYPWGEWWEGVYMMWEEKLKEWGYTDVKIWFSGFWSQGDGACFDAKVDTYTWVTKAKKRTKYRAILEDIGNGVVTGRIRTVSHHYSHENTRTLELDDQGSDFTKKQADLLTDLEAEMQDHRVDLCHEIYKDLEKEHEFLCSTEQLSELIEANEYTFKENGTRFG